MNKMIPFLLGLAVAAPLYFASPAQAQSLNDIQRLEEQVNHAKASGNWGAAQSLEVQLNVARLQYQRTHGLGEVNDRGYNSGQNGYYFPGQNNGYYQNTGYYNPGQNNGYYHPSQNRSQNNGRYQNNGRHNPSQNKDYRNNNRGDREQQRGYYDQRGRWNRY